MRTEMRISEGKTAVFLQPLKNELSICMLLELPSKERNTHKPIVGVSFLSLVFCGIHQASVLSKVKTSET